MYICVIYIYIYIYIYVIYIHRAANNDRVITVFIQYILYIYWKIYLILFANQCCLKYLLKQLCDVYIFTGKTIRNIAYF